ncbi:uncharacterized protein LOC132954984 [Labrus mixtus]|uniref:uncharacterized protein LOC132954984 n=1 Tax=Labrus mixtus TaxID=508554 RepID=UPI0029C04E85|nr:uncharacterized protein LOC132954984 [Labrus mixtus]
MGFLHVSVAVLSLLCVGHTAPLTDCDSLVQPLEIQGPEQLLGKWMRVAVSSNNKKLEMAEKNFQDSAWMKLTADNESDVITLTTAVKMFGICLTSTTKLTVRNNTLLPVTTETLNAGPLDKSAQMTLLKTGCSDCLLFHSEINFLGREIGVLILMSKRQNVTAAEMEELQKQAACLNLRQPLSLNFDKGICPEPLSPELDPEEQLKSMAEMYKLVRQEEFIKMMTEFNQMND